MQKDAEKFTLPWYLTRILMLISVSRVGNTDSYLQLTHLLTLYLLTQEIGRVQNDTNYCAFSLLWWEKAGPIWRVPSSIKTWSSAFAASFVCSSAQAPKAETTFALHPHQLTSSGSVTQFLTSNALMIWVNLALNHICQCIHIHFRLLQDLSQIQRNNAQEYTFNQASTKKMTSSLARPHIKYHDKKKVRQKELMRQNRRED